MLCRSVKPLPSYRDFGFFKIAAAAILDLWNYNFYGQTHQQCQTASPCQISWRSVKPLPRYRDYWITKDGDRRHLGFLKFYILNGRNGQEGRTAPLCQISSKFLVKQPRYGDFSIFPGWRPSAVLDLWCMCWDHPRKAFGGLYHCAKFDWNRWGGFDDMHVFRFGVFGLKRLMAQNHWTRRVFKSSKFQLPVRRGNMRCADRSNRCRDIAIIELLKMATAAIFDF